MDEKTRSYVSKLSLYKKEIKIIFARTTFSYKNVNYLNLKVYVHIYIF